MENLKTLENFYKAFEYFFVGVLMDKCGSRATNLTNLEDVETLKRFFNEGLTEYEDFSEVYEAIDDFKIVEIYGDCGRKKNIRTNKIICLHAHHELQKN